VLAHCAELNVNTIYMPNVDHASIDNMLEVEAKYPKPMCGYDGPCHPCSVKKDLKKKLYLVESWLHKKRFGSHWRDRYRFILG
jgi:TatD DNase family protein